jgi:soluble P-type ATPase
MSCPGRCGILGPEGEEMIEFQVPGRDPQQITHLLLDFNGTLARDGLLLDGVSERLLRLADQLGIQILTADHFGRVRSQMEDMPCEVIIIPAGGEASSKLEHLRTLGGKAAAIGNGENDVRMLEEAAVGIAVLGMEGASPRALMAADIACGSILEALDLLENPDRIAATLRS